MIEYEFEYNGGEEITCTRSDGSVLDWIPPIHGLAAMAGSAKRVFYADLVKDMQAGPSVINSVGVITTNFGAELGGVDTGSIATIKTQPLADLKGNMKTEMTLHGTYVEKPNIPKSSTSGVAPKKYSDANFVYYDSGESPSDICLNPNVTHLVDSAYCLDPASGTKQEPKDYKNYRFRVNRTITEGLFGFPSYYSFATTPTGAPENCQVRYDFNATDPGNPNPLDVAFNIADGKNTAFNSQYSNAVKNVFITRNSGQRNDIIKKLVIKESGDCAQIWSIFCELIIGIEESNPGASPEEKQAAFKTLRGDTLLITTDSVVFSRGIPFCNVSNNGGREGVESGCFTQQYFTLGDTDYPKAYRTHMEVEKKRIIDQNNVIVDIFSVMREKRFSDLKPFYFYRLIDTPGSRRPKKEMLYNPKLYDRERLEDLCQHKISHIAVINTAITTTNPINDADIATIDNPDDLARALKNSFQSMELHGAAPLYFSKDPNGNCMVHDSLHTEIEGCLLTPRQLKASADNAAIAPGPDDDPDDDNAAATAAIIAHAAALANGVDGMEGTFSIDSGEPCGTFWFRNDDEIGIDGTLHVEPEEYRAEDEDNEDFSYYECLVAYMILQDGLDTDKEYVRKEGGTIYIRPSNFLEEYDTFMDEYKKEAVQGGARHNEVQVFIDTMTADVDRIPAPGEQGLYKICDINVRQIGARCLRVILNNFLVRKESYNRNIAHILAEHEPQSQEQQEDIEREAGRLSVVEELGQGLGQGLEEVDDNLEAVVNEDLEEVDDEDLEEVDDDDELGELHLADGFELGAPNGQLQHQFLQPNLGEGEFGDGNYGNAFGSKSPQYTTPLKYNGSYGTYSDTYSDTNSNSSNSQPSSQYSNSSSSQPLSEYSGISYNSMSPSRSRVQKINKKRLSGLQKSGVDLTYEELYKFMKEKKKNDAILERRTARNNPRGIGRLSKMSKMIGVKPRQLFDRAQEEDRGGKRRTMKVKKYLKKNNHKKTLRKNKKILRNNKKTLRNNRKKTIGKHKKTHKSKP